MTTARSLASQYQTAHNEMRNADGLQPQEALDELLKYLFFKEHDEKSESPISPIKGSPKATGEAIKKRFQEYLRHSKVAPQKWGSEGIALSDVALGKVHEVFAQTALLDLGLDLRSSALRVFLNGSVRKGLGIFLTPDEIVREIVVALNPTSRDSIIDPACGSGTFLFETVRYIRESGDLGKASISAIDKNPRMLQLAEFNCGHLDGIDFQRTAADSLGSFGSDALPAWYQDESFDLVLTNPPFGVSLDASTCDFSQYLTGGTGSRIASEIVFFERALQLLRPGGMVGIVLPRSVITNQRIAEARAKLGKLGFVRALITLPAETFSATGTQTTTVVVIAQRYTDAQEADTLTRPILARIENVGFDSTGRFRPGSELAGLGDYLRGLIDGEDLPEFEPASTIQVLDPRPAGKTFHDLEAILGTGRGGSSKNGRKLRDLIELATTGATPPRSAYADEGLFLVKVGNLSGSGINWVARDRNFVAGNASKRYTKAERQLRAGDLLLTSSAHASKYIAKKVDIVTQIPAEVGGGASFVGEVMLLRPAKGVDPFQLLAYIRHPAVTQAIQDRVRGQTAHLYPDDVLEIELHEDLWASDAIREAANLNRRQAELNDELNALAFAQTKLDEDSLEQFGLI